MKTQNINKMVEWYSAERIHEMTKHWLSDLNFIKDEQEFLEELIINYKKSAIEDDIHIRIQKALTALLRTKRGNQLLINEILRHKEDLKLMVDGKDELEKEKNYKTKHKALSVKVSSFFYDYKAVKFEVFSLVKTLMKTEKQVQSSK